MFAMFAGIPALYALVDKLCADAEEAEVIASKEFAEAQVLSEMMGEVEGIDEMVVPAKPDIEVHVPGVGTLLVTPNEARDLRRHPGTLEYRRALSVARARNRKQGRVA
jgi:hypothetical protein